MWHCTIPHGSRSQVFSQKILAQLRVPVLANEFHRIPELFVKPRRLEPKCRERYSIVSFASVRILDGGDKPAPQAAAPVSFIDDQISDVDLVIYSA